MATSKWQALLVSSTTGLCTPQYLYTTDNKHTQPLNEAVQTKSARLQQTRKENQATHSACHLHSPPAAAPTRRSLPAPRHISWHGAYLQVVQCHSDTSSVALAAAITQYILRQHSNCAQHIKLLYLHKQATAHYSKCMTKQLLAQPGKSLCKKGASAGTTQQLLAPSAQISPQLPSRRLRRFFPHARPQPRRSAAGRLAKNQSRCSRCLVPAAKIQCQPSSTMPDMQHRRQSSSMKRAVSA